MKQHNYPRYFNAPDSGLDRYNLPHSKGDVPAIYSSTNEFAMYKWYEYGIAHREHDLPAVIFYNKKRGTFRYEWFWNGELHRENDLPAVEDEWQEMWYKNGNLHRICGPAYIGKNDESGKNITDWYIENNCITDQVKDICDEYQMDYHNLTEDDTTIITIILSAGKVK